MKSAFVIAFSVALALIPVFSHAVDVDTVDLSDVPPDLSHSVDPNFVITFDDSASMALQSIPDGREDDTLSRFYSSSWNRLYYDPNIRYQPALFPDGTPMPDSDYTKASLDGICANRPSSMSYYGTDHTWCGKDTKAPIAINLTYQFAYTFDLTAIQSITKQGVNFDSAFYTYFAPLGDPASPEDGAPGGSGALPSTPAGCGGTSDTENDACYIPVLITTAAHQKNIANWFSYYRFRNLAARSALSRAMGTQGSAIRVTWQTIASDSITDFQYVKLDPGGKNDARDRASIDAFAGDANNQCKSLGTVRCDFFNWLYAVLPQGGYTPNRTALIRVGDFFGYGKGVTDSRNPYYDAASTKDLSCRHNFSLLITDGVWNDDNPASSIPEDTQPIKANLPDGTPYDPANAVAQIYGNEDTRAATCSGNTVCAPSLADIAFYYWATDLRTDLTNNVPTHFPDLTTGITGKVPYDASKPPESNAEVYFNPANDPATWQHVVTYIIGLGMSGVPGIDIPNSTVNWDATGTDAFALRTGNKKWPSISPNDPSALDDTWHATVNGRGAYFNAANPRDLVNALSSVFASVAARRSGPSVGAVSASVVATGSDAFVSGFDSTDWSGYLRAEQLDTSTLAIKIPLSIDWDAACLLTGGPCNGKNVSAPDPIAGAGAGARHIVTKKVSAANGSQVQGGGIPFQWTSLSADQQGLLDTDPQTGASDGYGLLRLQYVRGERAYEFPTATPQLRPRTSLLGPIVNSQPTYVSYPTGGFSDTFPSGSAEATAAAKGDSYEKFASDNLSREAMVYVGANDGMLHAFDAKTGVENWAYVPATLFPNLNQLPRNNPFVYRSSVDNTPVVSDVFFKSDKKWHTVLIGTLRLGGRGVFAIDVTDPTAFSNEKDASSNVLWEFSNVTDPKETTNLGYTFGVPTVGRIGSGQWVALVPGGYFCATITTGKNPPNVPESSGSRCPDQTAPSGASADHSSLFVLDAETGQLVKEIQTPGATNSYGLAAPVLGDYEGDQIADFAVAGDMQGNLWRFDLSDPTPANWQSGVDLIYQPDQQGQQPITLRPRLFPDPATHRLTVVFGTGRYVGLSDRTSTIPQQSYYGIREVGPSTSTTYPANYYPVTRKNLTAQVLTANPSGTRTITSNPVPTTGTGSGGWYFDLPAAGERAVVTPGADFGTNRAFLISLIPGGDDPCSPSRTGALMIVDGASGGIPVGYQSQSIIAGLGAGIIGQVIDNPPTSGVVPMASSQGGGAIGVPGITLQGGSSVNLSDTYWRRSSWREVF